MAWQRKRLPEDVPTPVAVAVSDFCRRARAPASPGLVRDALAMLEDADDLRVRELTDAEPTARLGPFALVDVVRGTRATVAAEREHSGYYDEIRKVARESKVSRPDVPVLTSSPRPKPPRAAPSAPRVRNSATR